MSDMYAVEVQFIVPADSDSDAREYIEAALANQTGETFEVCDTFYVGPER